MRAARASRLVWIAPPAAAEPFARTRARLEAIAVEGAGEEVYTAKRRSLHRVEDAVLGPLAVKEVRNPGRLRRLRYGYLEEHRALREFRIGAAFEARGGRTPGFLAAALERDGWGLHRVLLFLRWLEGAETLTEHLRRVRPGPDSDLLDALAGSLVAAARLGLVHGRHSSENLLVVPADRGVAIHVIDFAYSRLGEGLDDRGLARDVARVTHRLLHEGVCSREVALALCDRVSARAWPDPRIAARERARLVRNLDRALRRVR